MTVRVRVGEPGGWVVALWERHPEHPGGEVFLAGGGEFEVALTPAVEARLRDGRLVVVDGADAPAKGKQQEGSAIAPAAVETPEAGERVVSPRPRKSASARKGGL